MNKITEKQKEKNKAKSTEIALLHQWFREIWDSREDEVGNIYCFETGEEMHGSVYRSNTCCYDHVLEKNNDSFPQYKFVKKNIVIIHPDVHTRKTSNIDLTPKIKKYRDYLLNLHEQGNLKD